jgi:hypothetical protein
MADGPVRDFLGTDSGEWSIVNGDFAVAAGSAAVPQGIRVRLGLFIEEAYLEEDKGVDYLGSINVKNPDPLVVKGILSDAISDTPDVVTVIGVQLQVDSDREGSISYAVDTVYSEQPFTGTIETP